MTTDVDGGGKVRVYGSYPLSQRNRFAGPDGARLFLNAFQVACSPENHHIAAAEPAGPPGRGELAARLKGVQAVAGSGRSSVVVRRSSRR